MVFGIGMDTVLMNGVTLGDILSIDWMVSVAGNLLVAIATLLLALFLSGWVRRRIIGLSSRHARIDDTLFAFLGNMARYAILAFAVVFVLNRFGFQTTSLVALIGATGLAIGLALQGTLSNIAAGVMLIIFRPFKKGDFVEMGGHVGTVNDISLFTTEVASLGNVQLIIPNSEIWGKSIKNYSSYDTRRAEWIFGVSYSADLKKAEQIIRDTIMADERSRNEPEPFVQVNNLGDFSVDFLVRVWCSSSDYFQYQADMKRVVKEALDAGKVEIPFPTQTLIQTNGRP